MKKIFFLLLLTACAQPAKNPQANAAAPAPASFYVSTIAARGLDYAAPITKIAFGSCANQDKPEPIWKDVEAAKPDLFLFMGDNIYASYPLQQPIADQYRKLDLIPEYRSVREKVPFMATWDDHDFGLRDGGAEWSGKKNVQHNFMVYWNYLVGSIAPEQEGIYHAKTLGPKKKSVQVIMLDTRFFRSPLIERPGNEGKAYDYIPSEEGTMLGNEQWKWLEAELKKPAQVRFIVSSIQLIAEEPKFEKWGNFPKERARFFELLKKTKAKNTIILSGDRHLATIAKMDLKNFGSLYDITSSSLNKANDYDDKDATYIGPVYNKENFGLATIDWKNKVVKIEIRGIDNKVVNTTNIKLK